MKTTSKLAVSLALFLTTLGSAVLADTLPASLQARYTALIAACKKVDLKTYDSFYSSDYVSVDPSGKKSSRAEYMAAISGLLKGAKSCSLKLDYKGVKSHNGIVEVSFDCTGLIVGKTGTTTFHEVGVDSWKQKGKVWMEIKTVDSVMDVKAPAPKKK